MASRANTLPLGITRVHPHTRRTLRTAAELAACPKWVWRVRVKRRGTGDFDQLYPQNVRDSAGGRAGAHPTQPAAHHDLRHPARVVHRQQVRDGVWLVTGPGGRGMTCSPAIAETTANQLDW